MKHGFNILKESMLRYLLNLESICTTIEDNLTAFPRNSRKFCSKLECERRLNAIWKPQRFKGTPCTVFHENNEEKNPKPNKKLKILRHARKHMLGLAARLLVLPLHEVSFNFFYLYFVRFLWKETNKIKRWRKNKNKKNEKKNVLNNISFHRSLVGREGNEKGQWTNRVLTELNWTDCSAVRFVLL